MASETITTENRRETVSGRWSSLFNPQEVDVSTLKTKIHKFTPLKIPTPQDTTYDFSMGDLGEQWLDLRTITLYVRGKMLKADGSAINTKEDVVGLVNNSLYSLFKTGKIIVGGNQLEMSDPHFGYNQYFKAVTHLEEDKPQSENQGFQLDYSIAGSVEKMNSGGRARAGRVATGSMAGGYEMQGRLLMDFFDAEPYLLPGTPLKVTLIKADPSFYLLADSPTTQYKFDIDEIYLSAVSVQTLSAIRKAVESNLEGSMDLGIEGEMPAFKKQKVDAMNAAYRFDSTAMRQMTVPKGQHYAFYSNMYQGILPRKIAIGFVSQEAVAGRQELNPYNFENLKVSKVTFLINGNVEHTISTDFDKNMCLDAYTQFLEFAGLQNSATPVRKASYRYGNAFFCYDGMKSCEEGRRCNDELLKSGTFGVNVEFKEPLLKSVTLMAFATRASTITLDRERYAELKNSIA